MMLMEKVEMMDAMTILAGIVDLKVELKISLCQDFSLNHF